MSDSSESLHAMAGACGGIVAMVATYPLGLLSTREAVDTSNYRKSTTRQALFDIISREGITGLFNGLNSGLVSIAVSNGVYYYVYERCRETILRSSAHAGSKAALGTVESMLAGLIAGSATSIIVNPLWVIQTAQATYTMSPGPSAASSWRPPSKKLGMVDAFKLIVARDGLEGLWRGIGPALVLVANPVLQYAVFEQLENLLIRRRTAKLHAAGTATAVAILSNWDFFFLGAISKLVATTLIYPYIVVKSRLQAGHVSTARYKSSLDGMLTIIREEGIQGLYKGLKNKLLQSVLTAAILFATQHRIYEITKKAVPPLRSAHHSWHL